MVNKVLNILTYVFLLFLFLGNIFIYTHTNNNVKINVKNNKKDTTFVFSPTKSYIDLVDGDSIMFFKNTDNVIVYKINKNKFDSAYLKNDK